MNKSTVQDADPALVRLLEKEEMSKNNIKVTSCISILYIAITTIIMLICFFGCDDKKEKLAEHTKTLYNTTGKSNIAPDHNRRKRIAKWIRECDDREWRNPDGNIAIKKAAKHFGISESEAMNIALEGVKNGW